jgi:UDP-N-acetylglucosamine 2-epimerase (non-hydrolysing)
MNQVFFDELQLRKPDYMLETGGLPLGKQVGKILELSETIFIKEKPEKVLILGDTNSALSAIMARRLGIPVYHMEAGNRSFDDTMPEEVNRRIVDHISNIHMPYTERSRANLLREGIASDTIYVIGNPIMEVLDRFQRGIISPHGSILDELNIERDKYIVVTIHRQENVTVPKRLTSILEACSKLATKLPVIFSLHPRTRKIIKALGLDYPSINFHEPFGLADFLDLEQGAKIVLTDSGTVQEECCIKNIRCVTVRDNTERPETIECGSNILSGTNEIDILRCVKTAMAQKTDWASPAEYLVSNVSGKVINILLGV